MGLGISILVTGFDQVYQDEGVVLEDGYLVGVLIDKLSPNELTRKLSDML